MLVKTDLSDCAFANTIHEVGFKQAVADTIK